MDGKLLVVASIISARKFPNRPDYNLVVKGFFNKECLDTDPVPHVGPAVQINTELAWEMSKKDLQYHKLHRTPIKLLCIAEKKDRKEECGYIMLDLRSAKQKDISQEPRWYPVLNSVYSKKRQQQPELQVCLTLEGAEPASAVASRPAGDGGDDSELKLVLHSSGEFYTLGPTNATDARMFLYSVTLLKPMDLPKLSEGESCFHFYFDLFGHHMASESFVPDDFRSERSAIRIKTTKRLLLRLLKRLDNFMMCLCSGSRVVGKGNVAIRSLGVSDSLTTTVPLGIGRARVDVRVSVEESGQDRSLSSSSDSSQSGQGSRGESQSSSVIPKNSSNGLTSRTARRNLSKKFEDASAAAGYAVEFIDPDGPQDSMVSNSSHHHPGHAPLYQPGPSPQHFHHAPTVSSSSEPSLPHPRKTDGQSSAPTGIRATSEHQSNNLHHHHHHPHNQQHHRNSSSPPPSPHERHQKRHGHYRSSPDVDLTLQTASLPHIHTSSPTQPSHSHSLSHQPYSSSSYSLSRPLPPPGSSYSSDTSRHNPQDQMSVRYSRPTTQDHKMASDSRNQQILDQHGAAVSTESQSVGVQGSISHKGNELSTGAGGDGQCKQEIYFSEAVWFSTGQFGHCQHFRFSLDMRSLQDSSLEVGPSYYLRYSYAFFGCPYPVLVQPPVPLVFPGANLSFIQSFCSFDFAVQHDRLLTHLKEHPLTVEVWSAIPNKRDFVAGIAQVPLHEVFSQDKVNLPDGSVRQMVTLQCPVYSPCSNFLSEPNAATDTGRPYTGTPLLASLNITVVMEDLGVLTSEKVKSGDVSHFTTKKQSRRMDQEMQQVVNSQVKMPPVTVATSTGIKESSGVGGAAGIQGGLSQGANGGPGMCSMSGSPEFMEYRAAMELEMWKASEEEAFQEYLKNLEVTHMSKLGAEWRKRETERHELFKKKLDQYTLLEKRLMEGLQKLQVHQQNVAAKETKVDQEKVKLKQEKENIGKVHDAKMSAAQATFEQQIEMERKKVSDLQQQLDATKKKMREELKSKDVELEKYKLELPSSKLKSDLEIMRLEKEELQRKVTVLSSAKDQYKNKWKEALAELARHHRQEQHLTQKRLMEQEKELEELRRDIVKLDEQNNLNLQINSVKEEAERIQDHIMSMEHEEAEGALHSSRSHSHHHAQRHASTSPSSHHHHSQSPPLSSQQKQLNSPLSKNPGNQDRDSVPNIPNSLTSDVARWIEEREILLQTGVYSDTDVTIQTLDAKIRGAMSKINSE